MRIRRGLLVLAMPSGPQEPAADVAAGAELAEGNDSVGGQVGADAALRSRRVRAPGPGAGGEVVVQAFPDRPLRGGSRRDYKRHDVYDDGRTRSWLLARRSPGGARRTRAETP